MWTTLKRILAGGATSFARSGLVSFATVLIMTVTIIIIGFLLFLSAILSSTLTAIEDKVDVNVYFTTTASEDEIVSIQHTLEKRPDVAAVQYTSRDEALADFRAKHADDQLTLQALDQLGDNPLGASLAIKAQDPTQYAGIVDALQKSQQDTGLIDRINYFQNKVVIDRLTNAIHATQEAGLAVVILFAIASIIIALATVRLAIYSARDEIAVMRLVGASNMYIRGPFVVAGMISGLIAGLIALLVFFPMAWYAGKAFTSWLGGFNIFSYYTSHFALIFGILVGSGVLLGAIAAFWAVRRYLRI